MDFVGVGGCRLVYGIDKRRVLKLAISKDGLEQNKQEYDVSKDWNGDQITKVLDHDKERYAWLISERAVPYENRFPFDCHKLDNMFNSKIGVSFYTFSRALEHVVNHVYKPHPDSTCFCREEIKRDAYRLREESQWFKDILGNVTRMKDEKCDETKVNLGFDLHEYNMGYAEDDKGEKRIVILDYGLLGI